LGTDRVEIVEEIRVDRERTFPAEPGSAAAARRFVGDTFAHSPVDPSTAQLLVSELATNAIVHTNSPFRVRVTYRDSDTVRVEVIDDEPELALRLSEPTDTGGRGLHILQALAQRWGTESTRDHKVVWFDLSMTTDAGSMA
jgi:anti-sigma regulatory factor (Ser/Thr protein kinase)